MLWSTLCHPEDSCPLSYFVLASMQGASPRRETEDGAKAQLRSLFYSGASDYSLVLEGLYEYAETAMAALILPLNAL